MALEDQRLRIASHQTTHVGCLKAFDTIVNYLGHHVGIIKKEKPLIAALDKYATYESNLNLVILAANAVNGKIETSEIGTQRTIAEYGMAHIIEAADDKLHDLAVSSNLFLRYDTQRIENLVKLCLDDTAQQNLLAREMHI